MNSLYRSMFFVPGNDPSKVMKAEIYRPDSIILDLEDAVSIHEKDVARILVRRALESLDFPCPAGVRINGLDTELGEEDVRELVKAHPAFLRLPKSESAADIRELDRLITEEEQKYGLPLGEIKIISTIEGALGVLNSYEIATASPRMMAIGLGAEDFCADMKTLRSESGVEIAWARSMLVTAAHAAGIMALDCVYSDFKNEEGFSKDTKFGKQLGYTGRSVIHPSQIAIVHEVYTPGEKELEQAKKVIDAYQKAMESGSGVVALDGKMIDMPIVLRAQYILERAGEVVSNEE